MLMYCMPRQCFLFLYVFNTKLNKNPTSKTEKQSVGLQHNNGILEMSKGAFAVHLKRESNDITTSPLSCLMPSFIISQSHAFILFLLCR